MISNRPMIPMLTHVDNLGDLNLDMTFQEQSLETIANNTNTISNTVNEINQIMDYIGPSTSRIENLVSEINLNSSETNVAVGRASDTDTATTVIGLLKSIVNKLS